MRFFYVSLIIVILDQITKVLVKFNMDYGSSVELIGDFLQFTYIENPGMAFGLDFGPSSKFFLSLFSILASIGLAYYLYKIKDEPGLYKSSIALILGGAVGNLIDRVFYGMIFQDAPLMYGRVIDFINVEFFDFSLFGHSYSRWPVFNIADAAVTIGVILLLFANPKPKKSIEGTESTFTESENKITSECVNIETKENV